MLAVARCVPSMEAIGVADARDGDPDTDRSPLATVAEGESVCEEEPETVNKRLCVSAGVCELVSDSKGDSVTTAVEVGESVATPENDAVAVGVPDANDESDAEPEIESVRSEEAVDDAEPEIVGVRSGEAVDDAELEIVGVRSGDTVVVAKNDSDGEADLHSEAVGVRDAIEGLAERVTG